MLQPIYEERGYGGECQKTKLFPETDVKTYQSKNLTIIAMSMFAGQAFTILYWP